MLSGQQDELSRVRSRLDELSGTFGDYLQSPLSIPLVGIISASENNLRPGLRTSQLRGENERLLFTSPLPDLLIDNGLPSYEHDAYFGALPTQVPRVLVLQGTLDPKTPFEGAQAQVQALRPAGDVQLVAVQDAPHFILFNAPSCFKQAAQALLGGHMAADERCSADAATLWPRPWAGQAEPATRDAAVDPPRNPAQ